MARGDHVVNKLILSLKKHARYLTGDTGSTGRYFSMCLTPYYHIKIFLDPHPSQASTRTAVRTELLN